MKMFFTSNFKVAQFLIFGCNFLVNVGCFSTGLPDLGVVFTGLALLTRLSISASLLAIMIALGASITACVITWSCPV